MDPTNPTTTETTGGAESADPKATPATAADASATKTDASAPTAETATTSASAPPPAEDDRLRRGFSALTKKEKALRQKEQQIKAAEDQLKRLEALRQKAKDNPIEVLQEFGLTYDQLTDYILGTQKEVTPEDRIAAIEERIERERKEAEERAAKAEAERIERTIASWKEHTLKRGLQADADRWELVNSRGDDGVELVWEVIESYHQTHGEVLDWQRAADEVEKHMESEARKILGLKKFQTKAQSAPQDAPPKQETKEEGGSTLSRSSVGEVSVISDESLPLDPDDRNRAILSRMRLWG